MVVDPVNLRILIGERTSSMSSQGSRPIASRTCSCSCSTGSPYLRIKPHVPNYPNNESVKEEKVLFRHIPPFQNRPHRPWPDPPPISIRSKTSEGKSSGHKRRAVSEGPNPRFQRHLYSMPNSNRAASVESTLKNAGDAKVDLKLESPRPLTSKEKIQSGESFEYEYKNGSPQNNEQSRNRPQPNDSLQGVLSILSQTPRSGTIPSAPSYIPESPRSERNTFVKCCDKNVTVLYPAQEGFSTDRTVVSTEFKSVPHREEKIVPRSMPEIDYISDISDDRGDYKPRRPFTVRKYDKKLMKYFLDETVIHSISSEYSEIDSISESNTPRRKKYRKEKQKSLLELEPRTVSQITQTEMSNSYILPDIISYFDILSDISSYVLPSTPAILKDTVTAKFILIGAVSMLIGTLIYGFFVVWPRFIEVANEYYYTYISPPPEPMWPEIIFDYFARFAAIFCDAAFYVLSFPISGCS